MIENDAICVQGKRIVEVGSFPALKERYPQAEVIRSDDYIALPGFIDIHNHAQDVSTFGQGLMDDQLELWSVGLASLD